MTSSFTACHPWSSCLCLWLCLAYSAMFVSWAQSALHNYSSAEAKLDLTLNAMYVLLHLAKVGVPRFLGVRLRLAFTL